jgi:hypothetical protein
MAYDTLDWQIEQRVLALTLGRPAQLNASTVEMAAELIDAYQPASETMRSALSSAPAPARPSVLAWICPSAAMSSGWTRR